MAGLFFVANKTIVTNPGLGCGLVAALGPGESVTEFSELASLELVKRYRQLAADACREADGAQGNLKQSYTLIAEDWENLAVVLEEALRDGTLKEFASPG